MSRNSSLARRRPLGCEAGIYFDRSELRVLLDLYNRRVAGGEWRDYALHHDGRRAVFAAFRHSLALPHCTVEKLARGAGFRLWRRGRGWLEARSLQEVMAALDGGPRLVVRS